ncbi:hypothetical protein [Neobacillus dielmonensis]|uniref:hypothetical protein n=1 Tax=Neobacillus dielmonensis TaxID=1347369 RepID=UPI0005AA6CAD|nr:hypothetical protein [Neobacillus dielmonensis]
MEETEAPIQNDQEGIFENEESGDIEEGQNIDPFTALMFGQQHRSTRPQINLFPVRNSLQNRSYNQSGIDLERLIYHIDTLVESVNGLKPLFKKAYPYIQKVLSKK